MHRNPVFDYIIVANKMHIGIISAVSRMEGEEFNPLSPKYQLVYKQVK